ncbi:MAG: glutathione transferase GstA [Gammaproteobacteria bacterium CG_4_10_14_0_8_um_filter_38_16]|nr:MAG: glutathione transferase GstA [Gammaproteobacteria bacterium CG_4_10_14_0_8_um_filter_38_16]PJA04131.1 MAG: glutathione transferase GstA [Gammaproteobacteria bacterium CG_4_10_14_0_2_um_filter_38_22]PJB10002.1 MAG: glutathione transferase GstA [Gammaproteobacteria bacterium CG_4_9_14_3_um_filter_38_9]
MIKLFFFPGACCMSCHIALEEAHIPFELQYVGNHADENIRQQFLQLNPLGAVPVLQLENGQVITQNIAILEYIADQKPSAGLLDKPGSYERADILRWLSFVAADLHKAFSPVFAIKRISDNPSVQHDIKKWAITLIDKYLMQVEQHLQNKTYLCAERFTAADAYLFTVYRWSKAINLPTEKYTALNRYADHIKKRPSVIAVLEREAKY